MEGKQQQRKRTLASSIMDEEAVKQLRAWYQNQQHAQALLEEFADTPDTIILREANNQAVAVFALLLLETEEKGDINVPL